MSVETPGMGTAPSPPPATARTWRRRILRALLGATALMIVLFVARQFIEASCWRGFRDRQRALAATIASRPGARTPVPEHPAPGEAWDEYHEAALVLGIVPRARRLRPGNTPVPLETADSVLAECAAGLDHLRAGARCETATRSRRAAALRVWWLSGFARELLHVSFLRNLSMDRLDPALEDLATMIQFGLDDSGRFDPFDAVATRMLSEKTLTPDQLGRLDRMYERAEGQVPSLAFILEDVRANLGHDLVGSDGELLPENWKLKAHFAQWWLAWSVRMGLARADEEYRDQIAAVPELENLPWDQALPGLRKADPRSLRWHTRFADDRYGIQHGAADVRALRARCRLIRAATMALRGLDTNSPAWPRDPFDFEPIRLMMTDTEIRVWSPGTDGDQGGVAETRSWPRQPWDLVLTVTRKPR